MLTKRNNALETLRRLAEKLRNSKVVLSGMLEQDLDQTLTIASTDGSKSWLPEINKRIEAIKSTVRKHLILS